MNDGKGVTYGQLTTDNKLGASPAHICALVRSDWEDGTRANHDLLMKLPQWYASFHSQNVGDVAQYRNNIGLPIAFSHIMTDVARKVTTLFSAWPIIGFEGYPDDAQATADKNSILVSAQLRNANSIQKAANFFIQGDLHGTAAARVGWTRIARLRNFRVGQGADSRVEKRHIIQFNGPDWSPVDLLDVRTEPNKLTVDEMGWVEFKYYESYDNLWEMNEDAIRETGRPLFLPGSLEQLKESQVPMLEAMKYQRFGLHPSLVQNDPTKQAMPYNKPVEIIERWGLVPREMAPDGDRNRCILVGNGHTLLRNDPNPHYNGKKPLILFSPTPDPFSAYGIGKMQVIEPFQIAGSRLLNQKLDGNDVALNPSWAADVRAIHGLKSLHTKPGRIWPIRGNPHTSIMPLNANLQGLQLAGADIEFLNRFSQMASGIAEAGIMGMDTGGSDRQTAREFLGRQEAATTRLAFEALLASINVVEPLGDWCRDMNQQYLPTPAEVEIIGDKALINPITGLPLPQERTVLTTEEINHGWRSKAVGPALMMSRAGMRQDGMQLLTLVSTIPQMAAMQNYVAWAHKIYGLFDGFSAKELLVQQVPQINAGAVEEAQGEYGGIGGAGGQSLTGGNPQDIADQLLGGGV